MPDFFYLKIADNFCRLAVDDKGLLSYLKKECFLLKGVYKDIIDIKVKKKSNKYFLTSDGGTMTIPAQKYKVISFILMSFIAYKMVKKDIFFIHASAFEKNGLGYVFTGPSGIGKSTIIKNVPYEKIYAEDMAIFRKNKDKFYLYPSPFDKKFVRSIDKPPVLIDKIFFLKQSDYNFINDIDFKSKISVIRSEVYKTYKMDKKNINSGKILNTAKNFYNLAFKIIKSVKIEKLNFKKNFNPYFELSELTIIKKPRQGPRHLSLPIP